MICLMWQDKTSSKDSNDWSIGFDQSNSSRHLELTDKKMAIKRRFLLRLFLEDVPGYAGQKGNNQFGLVYYLTRNGNINDIVLSSPNRPGLAAGATAAKKPAAKETIRVRNHYKWFYLICNRSYPEDTWRCIFIKACYIKSNNGFAIHGRISFYERYKF